MTRGEIGKVLAYLKAAYPRMVVEEQTLAVWLDALADLSPEDALAAVRRFVAGSNSDWPPSPGQIRRAYVDSRTQGAAAEIAWGEVKQAIASVGRYRVPSWTNPVLAHAVHSIGWETICNSDNEEATRAHFYRAYNAASDVVKNWKTYGQLEAARPVRVAELAEGVAKKLTGRDS